jgi:hypothetical protein
MVTLAGSRLDDNDDDDNDDGDGDDAGEAHSPAQTSGGEKRLSSMSTRSAEALRRPLQDGALPPSLQPGSVVVLSMERE